MTDWNFEMRPEGGMPLVECNFFDYLNSHPDNQTPAPAPEAINRAVGIGNEFLEKMIAEHPEKKIHFDVFWNEAALTGVGDPASKEALIGVTWAYNPKATVSIDPGTNYFWSMYSEQLKPDVPYVGKVRKDLLDYLSK